MAFPYTFEQIIAACRAPGVKPIHTSYGGLKVGDVVQFCPICCLLAQKIGCEEAAKLVRPWSFTSEPAKDFRTNLRTIRQILDVTSMQFNGFTFGVDGTDLRLFVDQEAYDLGVRVRKELFGS